MSNKKVEIYCGELIKAIQINDYLFFKICIGIQNKKVNYNNISNIFQFLIHYNRCDMLEVFLNSTYSDILYSKNHFLPFLHIAYEEKFFIFLKIALYDKRCEKYYDYIILNEFYNVFKPYINTYIRLKKISEINKD